MPASAAIGEDGTARESAAVNEVQLIGRLAAAAQERELPSGDRLVLWRVIVDRAPPARPRAYGAATQRTPTVDTIDCAALSAAARRSALSWQPGDVVSVQGALRRRFWRGAAGLGSRYEVEATAVRRLARAPAHPPQRSRPG